MKKTMLVFVTLIFLLAACSSGATPTAMQVSPTDAPVMTEAPAATEVAAVTEAPADLGRRGNRSTRRYPASRGWRNRLQAGSGRICVAIRGR
jgi:hypothetical protein